LWEQAVLDLLLAEGKITNEVVENIRSWSHSGFSVDQSVRIETEDTDGLRKLVEYFLRCPFSQPRMIEVTGEGKVLYKTEQNRMGRFPEAASQETSGRIRSRSLIPTAAWKSIFFNSRRAPDTRSDDA